MEAQNQKLQFSNKETAKRFDCLVEADRSVHKPQVYSGKLSNITPGMAEAMVKGGSNLLIEKAGKEQGAVEE